MLPAELLISILVYEPLLIEKLILLNKEYNYAINAIKDTVVIDIFNHNNRGLSNCELTYELFKKIHKRYPLLLDSEFIESYCERVRTNHKYMSQKNPYAISLLYAAECGDLDVIKFIYENRHKLHCINANILSIYKIYDMFYAYYNPYNNEYDYVNKYYDEEGEFIGDLYDEEHNPIMDYSIYRDILLDENGREVEILDTNCYATALERACVKNHEDIIDYFLSIILVEDKNTYLHELSKIMDSGFANNASIIILMEKHNILAEFVEIYSLNEYYIYSSIRLDQCISMVKIIRKYINSRNSLRESYEQIINTSVKLGVKYHQLCEHIEYIGYHNLIQQTSYIYHYDSNLPDIYNNIKEMVISIKDKMVEYHSHGFEKKEHFIFEMRDYIASSIIEDNNDFVVFVFFIDLVEDILSADFNDKFQTKSFFLSKFKYYIRGEIYPIKISKYYDKDFYHSLRELSNRTKSPKVLIVNKYKILFDITDAENYYSSKILKQLITNKDIIFLELEDISLLYKLIIEKFLTQLLKVIIKHIKTCFDRNIEDVFDLSIDNNILARQIHLHNNVMLYKLIQETAQQYPNIPKLQNNFTYVNGNKVYIIKERDGKLISQIKDNILENSTNGATGLTVFLKKSDSDLNIANINKNDNNQTDPTKQTTETQPNNQVFDQPIIQEPQQKEPQSQVTQPEIKKEIICPENTKKVNDECYELPPAGYEWITPGGLLIGKICPPGTTADGQFCKYNRGSGVPAKCPPGKVLRDGKCYDPPPAGYKWVSENGSTVVKICPDNTTESIDTCWYDRGVGVPLQCPSGKVQRGVECYDPPPAGYDWTTSGGLLIGKICPPGSNDSGINCWYDRGVGTPAICPPDKIQRGVECYEKPPPGYDWTTPGGLLIGKICPPGTEDSGTTCWYDRGVGVPLQCPPGKVQRGVECYDVPPTGYDWTTPGGLLIGKICPPGDQDSGTTCWYDRGVGVPLQCPPGKVQRGVECYDVPPTGYDWTTPGGLLIGKICPPGSNDSGVNCWYDRGVGTPAICPPDKIQRGVECYEKPPPGYDWTTPGGLLIGKICPPGSNDSGTTCWYDRGVGVPLQCPPGKVQRGVECYDIPPAGYDWTTPGGLLIGKICPPGDQDSGTTCWYDRGVGTPAICPSDKIQKGVECYEKPPNGYDWTTPGGLLIGKICPSNTNDSGTTCWYDRGVGTPLQCPPGKVQRGVECYDTPPAGFDWTTPGGLLIGKICPPGSNDSGVNCWYDRGVGTPAICPPDKVQKGVECYNKPPEGYDWTTPGGLLIGKICPPGSNDSGINCWYDRGVGTPAVCSSIKESQISNNKTTSLTLNPDNKSFRLTDHKIDCDNKLLNRLKLDTNGDKIQFAYKCATGIELDGATNKSTDLNDGGNGNTIYLDRHNVECGKDSAISSLQLIKDANGNIQYAYKCKPTTGTVCRKLNTQWDVEGDVRYLDRHDINCNTNEVISQLVLRRNGDGKYRYEYTCCGSVPDKIQRGIECYDPPPAGYDWTTPGGLLIGKVCPPSTNDSGTTCWYDRGVGTPLVCPPGKVQRGVECYDTPPEGYDWTTPGGLLIGKICPPGTNDSGTTCWYDRSVGIPMTCPPEQSFRTDSQRATALASNPDNKTYNLTSHKLDCDDKVISRIKLDTNGDKLQFAYTCATGVVLGPSVNKTTQWDDSGPGGAEFLDRHNIDCGPRSVISSLQLAKDVNNSIQYQYKCSPAGDLNCRNVTTQWDDEGNGDVRYLDRHNISCNNNEAISKIVLRRSGDGRYRYEYTCCSAPVGGGIQKGVECYEKPPPGYDWTTPGGLLIGKICPPGTEDSGTTCWYDRGVGVPLQCPPGKVQKGIECYDIPPAGYDWTTPGGLLIGKICPPGTEDSGTTCWYDRGVGRIPDKKTCATGLRDDGVSCWKDSYGNGVGTVPTLNPCPEGSKDVAGTCWKDTTCRTVDNGFWNYSWGSVGCTDNRPWRWEGYNDCYKTWISKLEIVDCPYVTKNIGDRGSSCPAGHTNIAGLCYKNCAPGYHFEGGNICAPDGYAGGYIATTLGDRQYCATDENMEAGLCYKKPKAGYECSLTHCKFSKDVKPGNKTGLIDQCPVGKINEGGLCYTPAKPGYSCTATHCNFSKEVRPGNKIGLIDYCAADKTKEGGLCYTLPKPGYTCTATNCSFSKEVRPGNKTGVINSCPDGKVNDAGLCYPVARSGFTCTATHCNFSKDVKPGNKIGLIDKCPEGKVNEGGLCYTPAKSGFGCTATNCSFSKDVKPGIKTGLIDQCPAGKVNEGGLCYTPAKSGFGCTATNCSFSKEVRAGNKTGLIDSCADGRVNEGGLCYTPAKGGFTCAATHCNFSKDVKPGTKTGLIDQCPTGKVNEAGLCYTPAKPGYSCTATHCNFSKDVKPGNKIGLINTCPDGRINEGGLCYIPAKPGFGCDVTHCKFSKDVKPGTKTGLIDQCPDGKVNEAGLCYMPAKPGFGCTATNCSFSKDVKPGNKIGLINTCPDGKVNDAGLCYTPAKPGYSCSATHCNFSKDVKPGNKIGLINTCPDDRINEGGLCYIPAKPGFGCDVTHCKFSKDVKPGTKTGLIDQCPTGKVNEAGLCYTPAKPGFGCTATNCSFSKDVKPGNKIGLINTCPDGKVNEAGLCYPKPRDGFNCVATICDTKKDTREVLSSLVNYCDTDKTLVDNECYQHSLAGFNCTKDQCALSRDVFETNKIAAIRS